MSLRAKLLVSLALVVILGIAIASLAVYGLARDQLEESTRTQLAQAAEMLAKQSEAWLNELKSDTILWASLPTVQQAALAPNDPFKVARACRSFQHMVKTHPVLQTVNLVTTDAACIASSIPSRIGFEYMQQVIMTRPDFHLAAAGKAAISPTFIAQSNGRIAIGISAPVWVDHKVAAVMRNIVDLAFFTDSVLRRHKVGTDGRVSILDQDLDTRLPRNWYARDVIKGRQYVPPEIPPSSPELFADRGFIQYRGQGGEYLAAFHKVKEPAWIIVVEMPLTEVLAPIQFIRKAALLTGFFLLVTILTVVFSIVNPGLRKILACLRMVQEIEEGKLYPRLKVQSNDEIGKLAEGLNNMAESLAESRLALEEAEATYRGIVQNAAEGIFQATADRQIVTANTSFAHILGYQETEDVIGEPLFLHFADQGQWEAFFAELQSTGVVKGFELTFARRDGTLRIGSMFAQAEKDDAGRLILIQGMLSDITEREQAERERRRAEEAESRLARSRLQALRYQINPHFLFNILNTVDALAKQAPARIPELIRELSRYLRFTLTDHERSLVPLRLELDAVTSYLKLEKIRFEDDLVVDIFAAPEVSRMLVPELLLQPLVENAIKYGMKTSTLPLRIAIRCTRTDGMVEMEVANTGKWLGETAQGANGNGIGLANLRKRLELLYPDRHQMTVEERAGWIVVRAQLPFSGMYDDIERYETPASSDR